MTKFIAKCSKGQIDYTTYESVEEAIDAVSATNEVVRVDRPRENYANVICKYGTSYSVIEHEEQPEAPATPKRDTKLVTEKQQRFLERLGNGRVPSNMPRRDASAIIDDALAAR